MLSSEIRKAGSEEDERTTIQIHFLRRGRFRKGLALAGHIYQERIDNGRGVPQSFIRGTAGSIDKQVRDRAATQPVSVWRVENCWIMKHFPILIEA